MLIICSECGKEYSDQAVCCPHCGAVTKFNSYNAKKGYASENNRGLALAGFIIGIISIFIFPILGILSIIFGAIAIGTNENNESWNKAIWNYENKALGFGRVSLMIGIIDVIWMFINFYSLMNL